VPRPAPPRRKLCLLLLPSRVEDYPYSERVADLLRAPGTAAIEPARIGSMRRVPDVFRDGIAVTQARRLKLEGVPRAIVTFSPLQYPLARALIARHPEAEIWYALDPDPPQEAALRELHDAAVTRASLRFAAAGEPGEDVHAQNRPLYRRMETLGIESGRLGSEREDEKEEETP
jgi:hypothetical protein